jgi:hypothetical protein
MFGHNGKNLQSSILRTGSMLKGVMKSLIAFIFAAYPFFAFAAPRSLSLDGFYKSGCTFCSTPATMTLLFDGSQVQVKIDAQPATCVISFRTGTYSGTFENSFRKIESYSLPIADNCGRKNVFGPYLRLAVQRGLNGEVTAAKILGERGGGRLGWEYFTGKVK